MATPKKTQIEKIENVLRKYTISPGVSARAIAGRARVPVATVYKRIHDLREYFGLTIYTNYRKIDGKRTAFYRLGN